MSELSSFIDNVDCLKRLFDWSRYVWCVKKVGFDLIDKLVSNLEMRSFWHVLNRQAEVNGENILMTPSNG
jgi:hypothetical protein